MGTQLSINGISFLYEHIVELGDNGYIEIEIPNRLAFDETEAAKYLSDIVVDEPEPDKSSLMCMLRGYRTRVSARIKSKDIFMMIHNELMSRICSNDPNKINIGLKIVCAPTFTEHERIDINA